MGEPKHWYDKRQWFFGEIEAMKTVLTICERWGYGNVMEVISLAWQDKDPTGALTVGPAMGTVKRRRRKKEELTHG